MRWVWKLGIDTGVEREGVSDGHRGLARKEVESVGGVGAGGEGVGAMVQHVLGAVVGVSRGGDAEVAEHRVGAPATKELDGVGIGASAQQGGSAAGTEAPSREEARRDAGDGFNGSGTVAEGIGDP